RPGLAIRRGGRSSGPRRGSGARRPSAPLLIRPEGLELGDQDPEAIDRVVDRGEGQDRGEFPGLAVLEDADREPRLEVILAALLGEDRDRQQIDIVHAAVSCRLMIARAFREIRARTSRSVTSVSTAFMSARAQARALSDWTV